MSDGIIRRCQCQDIPVLLCLLQHVSQWLEDQGKSHWSGYHTEERIARDLEQGAVLLLEHSGEPVGVVTVSLVPPLYHAVEHAQFWECPRARAAYIRKLAVKPLMHGRGYARLLMVAAENIAVELGASMARLDIHPNVISLRDFYKKLGYIERGVFEGGPVFEKEICPRCASE